MKKFLVLIMAILLVFTFAGCGGGGGGSSDDDDDDDATWPVEFYSEVGVSPVSMMRTAPATGTYSGGDPHTDGTIYVTGAWDTGDVEDQPITISSGAFDFGGYNKKHKQCTEKCTARYLGLPV